MQLSLDWYVENDKSPTATIAYWSKSPFSFIYLSTMIGMSTGNLRRRPKLQDTWLGWGSAALHAPQMT